MAKFNSEQKLNAVNRALSEKGSYRSVAKSIGVDEMAIHKWVKQYQYNGVEAFIKQYTNYSAQFKLDVLNHMIEHGTSLIETASIFGIAAPSSIIKWRKQFEIKGFVALQSKKKGRPSTKKETSKQPKNVLIESSPEYFNRVLSSLKWETSI